MELYENDKEKYIGLGNREPKAQYPGNDEEDNSFSSQKNQIQNQRLLY